MTQQPTWSATQLAVLQALEIPLHVRRQTLADVPPAATSAGMASWRLRGSAGQLATLQQLRWYSQLCRFRAPEDPIQDDHGGPIIVADEQALMLEGSPPRPSAAVKRQIYQALRTRRR